MVPQHSDCWYGGSEGPGVEREPQTEGGGSAPTEGAA